MALARLNVPTFLAGISQQSSAVRESNYIVEAENVEFLISDGATKRFPSELVSQITSLDLDGYRLEILERDEEDYLILIGDADIKVYTTDGTVVQVLDSSNSGGAYAPDFSYLSGVLYENTQSRAIADALFVSNRGTTVTASEGRDFPSWARPTSGDDQAKGEGGIFIKQATYNLTYTVKIKTASMSEAQEVTYTIPSVPKGQGDKSNRTFSSITAGQATGIEEFLLENASGGGRFQFNSVDELVFEADTGSGFDEIQRSDFEADELTGSFVYRGDQLTVGDDVRVRRELDREDFVTGDSKEPINIYARTDNVATLLAERLSERFDGNGTPLVEIERNRRDPSIRVSFDEPLEILEVRDSQASTFISGWTNDVENIVDLPLQFRHGALVRITGENNDSIDDYYVEFATEEWSRETDRDFDQFDAYTAFGQGQWIECQKRGEADGTLDVDTMPHRLQRAVDDGAGTITGTPDEIYFDWQPFNYSIRPVGDTESNVVPSFVNSTINDITFHDNRLTFVTDSAVVFAEAGVPENFWRSTIQSVPQSDPIDVDVIGLDGDTVLHAVPFDRQLYLWGKNTQAVVFARDFLSPQTIEAPQIGSFRCFRDVKPVNQGRSVFFGASTGNFSVIREFVPGTDSETFADQDITIATPRLIPSDVRRIVTGGSEQSIFALGSPADTLYVYKYTRLSGNLLQSAWSTFRFPGATIVDIGFVEDELFIVSTRNGNTHIEKLFVGPGKTDLGDSFAVRLDGFLTATGTYDRALDQTLISMPIEVYEDDNWSAVSDGTGEIPYGSELAVTVDEINDRLEIVGDVSGESFIVGRTYNASMTLTRPHVRTESNEGSGPLLGAHTSIESLILYLVETGYLRATVTSVDSDEAVEEFLGDQLSVGKIDDAVVRDGEMDIAVMSDPEETRITLENDTALPSTITSGSWGLRYSRRQPRS